MSVDYRITLTQVVTGNLVPVTSGAFHLRVDPFSANTYALSPLSDGVWGADGVNDGLYELWDTSGSPSKVTKFGRQWIGDTSPTFASVVVSGTASASIVDASTRVVTDVIWEKTSAAGVTIDAAIIKDGNGKRFNGTTEADNDVMFKDGSQTISGAKTFSGGLAVTGGSLASGSGANVNFNCDNDTSHPKGNVYRPPATDTHFVQKKFVTDEIAGVVVTPYQEASTMRRQIFGGTVEAGKVYTTLDGAIANVNSGLSSTTIGMIEIRRAGGTVGAFTLAGGISVLSEASKVAHVLVRGQGRATGVLIRGTSLNAAMQFENLTVYFSNTEEAGTRTVTNARFINCTIAVNNGITFGNASRLENCTIIPDSTNQVTLTGTAELLNCNVRNKVIFSTHSGEFTGFQDVNIGGLTDPVTTPS